MADNITPPTHESVPSDMSELVGLHDQLDDLWKQYLDLVDQHQEARREVQKHLSNGFFNLAQANFKAPHGRRYGQDDYDGRTKASRCYRYTNDGTALTMNIRSTTSAASKTATAKDADDAEPKQQETPPATPAAQDDGEDNMQSDELKSSASPDEDAQPNSPPSEEPIDKSLPDPLHWYGILVPRELRNAQDAFSSALGSPVVRVVTCTRELREIEAAINRTRKAVRKAEKVVADET